MLHINDMCDIISDLRLFTAPIQCMNSDVSHKFNKYLFLPAI